MSLKKKKCKIYEEELMLSWAHMWSKIQMEVYEILLLLGPTMNQSQTWSKHQTDSTSLFNIAIIDSHNKT